MGTGKLVLSHKKAPSGAFSFAVNYFLTAGFAAFLAAGFLGAAGFLAGAAFLGAAGFLGLAAFALAGAATVSVATARSALTSATGASTLYGAGVSATGAAGLPKKNSLSALNILCLLFEMDV